MRRALEVGVHCFNVESTDELERLQQVAAELGMKAPVSCGSIQTWMPAPIPTSPPG